MGLELICSYRARKTNPSKAAGAGKEKLMNEDMNQAEVAKNETEQKMIYKFLLMIKESESLEDLEDKTKALLSN